MAAVAESEINAPRPRIVRGQQEKLGEMAVEPAYLTLVCSGGRMGVYIKGLCYATFEEGDKFSRNFCFVQLHVSCGVKLKELSVLFRIGYQHSSNLVSRYKHSGLAGLRDDSKDGYGNRAVITAEVGRSVLRWREEGKSYEEISQLIRIEFKKKVKAASIISWMYRYNKRGQGRKEEGSQESAQLGFSLVSEEQCNNPVVEEQALSVGQAEVPSPAETLPSGETEPSPQALPEGWQWNSYAGAFILCAMIGCSHFLEVFDKHLGNGLEGFKEKARRVLLTLFFLQALRCKSIEQSKHIIREHFAQVVGGEFFILQPLRYAVDELVSADGFERAMIGYYRQMAELTERGDDLLYTDGHFTNYYGKRPVPKGYDPRRQRGGSRGRNTIYLHNSSGENVYLFESPTNTTLSKDIEELLADMVDKLGVELKGKTLGFDRGGFSANCFRALHKRSMYFITYLKNRKKQALLAEECFQSRAVMTEQGEVTYRVFEKESREMSYGQVRTIIFLAEDGAQIPVLTTNPVLPAQQVVDRLRRRWREENSIKYMVEHFGIDLLTTYRTEPAPDKVIERPHPLRKELLGQIRQKKATLEKLESELAKQVGERGEHSQQTIEQFFEQAKEINLAIKQAQVDLLVLKRKKEDTPVKEKRNLKDDHVIMAQKRRLLINSIKALNFNAEKWLQSMLVNFHHKADETLSLLRSLWKRPGKVLVQPTSVTVELVSQENSTYRASIAALLDNLKENNLLRLPDGRTLVIHQSSGL